jgi:hypothetical protein
LPSGKRGEFLKMLTVLAAASGPEAESMSKGKKSKRGKRK